MSELVKLENNQIVIAEETMQKMKALHDQYVMFKDMDTQIKEAVLKLMRENGIKKIDNDVFSITYTAPTKRETVDNQKLKDQGLYDSFIKVVPVKDSVKITYK